MSIAKVRLQQMGALLGAVLVLAMSQPARAEAPDRESFTGLVVQLQALSMQPSLNIRILSDDGQIVYGEFKELSTTATNALVDKGEVAFAVTPEDVKERCGTHPLVVLGLRVDGNDIIISHEAAAEIRQANSRKHFLDAFQVAIQTVPTAPVSAQPAAPAAPPAVAATAQPSTAPPARTEPVIEIRQEDLPAADNVEVSPSAPANNGMPTHVEPPALPPGVGH